MLTKIRLDDNECTIKSAKESPMKMWLNAKKSTVKIVIDEHECLIDREDLEMFAKYPWRIHTPYGSQTHYLRTVVNGKNLSFHRLIMEAPENLEVDHINRDGLDNRKSNLRLVTHQQNQNNLPKRTNASSKFYGVSWRKDKGRWGVYAHYDGKVKNVGLFDSEESAAFAYDNYLIKNNIDKQRNFE